MPNETIVAPVNDELMKTEVKKAVAMQRLYTSLSRDDKRKFNDMFDEQFNQSEQEQEQEQKQEQESESKPAPAWHCMNGNCSSTKYTVVGTEDNLKTKCHRCGDEQPLPSERKENA